MLRVLIVGAARGAIAGVLPAVFLALLFRGFARLDLAVFLAGVLLAGAVLGASEAAADARAVHAGRWRLLGGVGATFAVASPSIGLFQARETGLGTTPWYLASDGETLARYASIALTLGVCGLVIGAFRSKGAETRATSLLGRRLERAAREIGLLGGIVWTLPVALMFFASDTGQKDGPRALFVALVPHLLGLLAVLGLFVADRVVPRLERDS